MTQPAEYESREITPYERSMDVKRAVRAVEYLAKLHEKDPRLPEGVSQDAIAQAQKDLADLKATDIATMMLTNNVPGEVSLVMWNRARRALYALAPVVVMRLADKLDNAAAPGSERILSEVAKGLGLLVPGEPVSEGRRDREITQKDLADLPDEELEKMLNDRRGLSDQ